MPVKDVATVEQILIDEWRQLLPQADAETNIFAVGAHSLMVGRVASRCRAEHGLDLDFAWFFQYPVIGELARFAAAEPVAD